MTLNAYFVALVCISAYFLVTVLCNIVYFRRATRQARVRGGVFVSVVVPARNEEGCIARCVESLLKQDYRDYEVIVVDDQSSDSTADIVRGLAADDPRLRLLSGGPLPEGWLGKPHALSQGAAAATGDILIFTDADTVHGPDSISWAVTNLEDHKADLLSGYLNQEYGSFGERLAVPVMYAMMMAVPFVLLPRTKSPRLAFSIGQYVALRREAFDCVGGYAAIPDVITDDMSMVARMKAFGYRNVFLDAKRIASCRLYDDFRDASRGIERSIYSAVGGHPLSVLVVASVVFGLIVWPAFVVLAAGLRLEMAPMALSLSAALFAAQWMLIAWDRDVPLVAVVLYPLVFLNLVFMLVTSMLGTGFGAGVEWKGRLVRIPSARRASRDAKPAERY